MIIANLFHLQQTTPESDGFRCTLATDGHNPIYSMHFPGNPVTPGVCIIQACKELMEIQLNQKLRLQTLNQVKFLAVISPKEHSTIQITFSKITTSSNGIHTCNATTTSANNQTFAKLKLTFSTITPSAPHLDQRMRATSTCLLIPTYNHATFLHQTLRQALHQCSDIIIVDDGSTDHTQSILHQFSQRITIITLPHNRGKGHALAQGMKHAAACGFRNVITMDSDGQHTPTDLQAFISAAEANPGAMLSGARTLREKNMPSYNRFANRFSNFWFALQTARRLPDTQCGFRLYPLEHIQKMHPIGSRYETELAWLLQLAWKNIPIIPIPIHVDYQPNSQRPTHYRRSIDFMRISLLNALMCIVAIFYGYPRLLYHKLRPRR